MKLTQEQVEHIANLAKLALSAQEIETYQSQLSAILEHFEQLQELGTEDISPTAMVLPLSSVTRPDEVQPTLARDAALQNAPDAEDGCFKVPAVLE